MEDVHYPGAHHELLDPAPRWQVNRQRVTHEESIRYPRV